MKRVKRWLILVPVLALVVTGGCAKKKSNLIDSDAVDLYTAYVSEFNDVPAALFNVFDLLSELEIPPVTSSGGGSAFFTWEPSSLQYQIDLSGITGVTAADIRLGTDTENGSVLAHLFTGPTTGPVDGRLAAGTIDIGDVLGGLTWQEFRAKCQGGNAYVNVLTTGHPNGELRGQTARSGYFIWAWNHTTEEYSYTMTFQRGFKLAGTLDLAYFASTSTPDASAIVHVNLVSTPKQADANGLYATGMFTYDDIHGATQEQFLNALNAGHIGVLFKTAAKPNGLLRGQLLPTF